MNDPRSAQAVGRLPRDHEQVLRLFVFEGHSVREISQRLGIPEATVRTRLFRTRIILWGNQTRPP